MHSRHSGRVARISCCCFPFHSGPVRILPGPVWMLPCFRDHPHIPTAVLYLFMITYCSTNDATMKQISPTPGHTMNKLSPSCSLVVVVVNNKNLLLVTGHRLHSHFDYFSGATSDMILASCLDAVGGGCPKEQCLVMPCFDMLTFVSARACPS